MKINSNILNIYYKPSQVKYQQPKFTSECYDTTEFFRNDFNWNGFTYLINRLYQKEQHVNVVSYGCSTGKETYSLILTLKTILKDSANKFFPVIGKDIDATSILKAKRGRYKISNEEAHKLDKAGDINLYRHLDIIDDGLEKYAYIKDSLKTLASFSKADVSEDIGSIPTKNTVLLCRNFWGYLPAKQQTELADKLAKLLDKTCLVAIGSFDKSYGIDKLLEQKGFKATEIENVFRKLF